MIIEKLNLEGIGQVVELQKTITPFNLTVENVIKVYNKMLLNDDYFIATVKEDKEVIGSIMGIYYNTLAAPFLVIEDIVIKKGIIEKEICSKLMKAIDDFAKEKNVIIVSSWFREKNLKPYEKQGVTEYVRGFKKVY